MHRPMRVLLVSHGYPPSESAGTEQHVLNLADGLRQRGHTVHVLAATRAPGRHQYEVIEAPGLTRVVNNITTRRLSSGEQDRAIDQIIEQVAHRFEPSIVHVHHIQFLSSSMRFSAPTVVTLHDGWGWCAAGGQSLTMDGTTCPGPTAAECAPCATAWAPTPGSLATGMVKLAGWLSPVIAPERLHALYRRLPVGVRPQAERGAGPVATPADAAHRNACMRRFFEQANVRIAPSHFLAARAESQGWGRVQVIPHGFSLATRTDTDRSSGAFLHLGSIAHHKGTDRVVQAWRRAFPQQQPGLHIHGPIVDKRCALGHPIGPVLNRQGVQQALQSAKALVLAPRWEENAPMVIGEARANGCPVIAPRSGGIPEMIQDGVDGLLFEPDGSDALTEALRFAAEHTLPTPSLPPTLSSQVQAVLDVYNNLVQMNATGTGG